MASTGSEEEDAVKQMFHEEGTAFYETNTRHAGEMSCMEKTG